MEHAEDVGRLFSWLKAPMVHYREFTPQIELAEAVAAWPAVHRAAVETGIAGRDEPAPHGAEAALARIARERTAMPTEVADAIRQTPLFDPLSTPASPAGERQAGEAGRDALGEQPQGAEPAPAESMPQPAAERRAEAATPLPGAPGGPRPARSETARPMPSPPAPRDQGALFGGEYRDREREAPTRGRATDRQDRSLDAVFSRLSGGRDRLPDPRGRARTTPGLRGVFNRLR